MSIHNVKELFSRRVNESTNLNTKNESNNRDLSLDDENEDDEFTSLREIDVGITEYLGDCKGFSAVIKQRFSDFHVHEIDNYGNIAYLTDSEVPELKVIPVDNTILSEEYWEKLERIKNNELENLEIDVTDVVKENRKHIHQAIRYKYGSIFYTNTRDVCGKKMLTVSLKKNGNRDSWNSDLGQYLHFILFKKNCDTAFAINAIASQLKTNSSNLTYAGTKDKRAITSQWVSMWHLDAKRLNGINKSLQGLKVGNYTYAKFPLKLGDLKGNYFEIALRNVNEADEVLNESLNIVKHCGFLNYFGLQRFGNSIEIPTHEIGKALVKGDFKNAVELILKPRKGKMKHDLREARTIWWESRDASKALNCLKSKNKTIEGKLLLGLAKHGKNAYINALDFIPRNVRLLYLHAYQSFVWNKILSKRIKTFGKSVLEGDLIQVYKDHEGDCNSDDASLLKDEVRFLNHSELENFAITDIVHPLPGFKVVYPNNIIKEWYDKCLEEDGLTSEDLRQTVRKYSLSGTYRPIVQKMKDLTWNMCYYSDPEEDLILSDIDKLNNLSLNINQNNESKYKAVVLKFSLDSSTYATMALREILKIDTSCSYQATLNCYSNKKISDDDEPSIKRCKTNL